MRIGKRISMALVAICLLVSLMPLSPALAAEDGAAHLKLTLTPDGQLGVAKDKYESLGAVDRQSVSGLLTFLNQTEGSYGVLDKKLDIDENVIPSEFRSLALAWDGKNLDVRQAKQKPDKGDASLAGAPYPGAFSWYELHLYDTVTSFSMCRDRVKDLNHTPCQTLGTSLKLEIGESVEVKLGWSVSANLTKSRFESDLSFSVTYTTYATATITYEIDLLPGEKGIIDLCYNREEVTKKYNRWYFEDWDEDGVEDYVAYMGEEKGWGVRTWNHIFNPYKDVADHKLPCPVCGAVA